MTHLRMNNHPQPLPQSISMTSESSLSLSEIDVSLTGIASIVLTDSDGDNNGSDHFWHMAGSKHSHTRQSFAAPVSRRSPRQLPRTPAKETPMSRKAESSHSNYYHHSPDKFPRAPPSSPTLSGRSARGSASSISDTSTWPGLKEATPAMAHAPPAGTYHRRKEKYYVVSNGRTMGVFLDWDAVQESTTRFCLPHQDTASPTLEHALERWNKMWMTDNIGYNNESGSMAQPNSSKGKGRDILSRFYYIIIKGKVPHVVSSLEEAIEDAGEHPYREVFVTRDRLSVLEFLNKKLQDDEVL